MRLKSLLLTMSFFMFTAWAIGQTVKIDGEIRPRAEFRNGYKVLPATDAKAAFAISQRTRFNAFYGNESFKAFVSMQDVRVWGNVPQLDQGGSNQFAIHQAWGEYFFTENFSFKVGRQELVYDDSRILGNVGWAQQARAHDLGLFKYEKENLKVHLGLAFNQQKEALFGTDYLGMKNYKAMQFVWVHTKIGKSGLSFLFLNNGMEGVKDYDADTDVTTYQTLYSQTIGARFTPTLGPVKLAAAAYYQMGNIKNDSSSLSAMYFALAGTFAVNEKFGITAGFEYLSGTSAKDVAENPNDYKSFTPLYGTNHKFNGHMDYFYVGNHGNNVGLIDLYATFKMKFGKVGVFATPHYFMAAADVYRPKPAGGKSDFHEDDFDNMSKGLGVEIDLGVSYAPQKNMKFVLGISEMFGTETLAYTSKGYMTSDQYSDAGTWAYLMFVFKPNFYTSK
ncbi:MAG: alginate export family protein [Bacteroidales bacterium]|nr:alginate export family protein [Bacteroidales bacterium]